MAGTTRPGARRPLLVVALLVALLLGYLYQAGMLRPLAFAAAERAGLATAAPANPRLQAFFTTPTLVYPDKTWQRPAVPLLQQLIADIDRARSRVDIAVFDFDLPELADALLRAQRRGVAVRLVADSENLLTPEVALALGRLERAGATVRVDRREPFMHDKIAVIDTRIVWFGSWNMTENDTWRNNNNMIRAVHPELAAAYQDEVAQMLAGRFGTAKARRESIPQFRIGTARLQVLFAPQDGAAKYLLARIAAAKRSIRVLAFSFTSALMIDTLLERARAGVQVQVVLESQNATGQNAAFARLREAGLDVLLDGNCYNMHHKMLVIDEQTVITGSYNFTNSAERSNDENTVIVDDRDLAAAFTVEFGRVYAQALNPARCQ